MSTGVSRDTARLAHVARLHYLEDLSKQEIAARLGLSRFKVARLLEQARVDGVVRFEIDDPLAVDGELSRELERQFGLDLAVVTEGDSVETVARAAAAWLPSLASDGEPLGVAWGTTLSRVADALSPTSTGTVVVQLCGAIAGLVSGSGPSELALRFAERLGGRASLLPAPALASRATHEELRRDPTIAPTVAYWRRVDAAIVGIGATEHLPWARRRAVGHLLVHTYSISGQRLPPRAGRSQALAASWEELERIRVFAVASGERKREPVLGALRTGLLNGLFCDAGLGELLLERL